jgi:hypothetical protein
VVRDVLKLCALRGACTVSRGGSRSNTTPLPDILSEPGETTAVCFSPSSGNRKGRISLWEERRSAFFSGGDQ